jgi:dethiobiotin synthetase
MGQIIFITATDTGVGKTLLTALLLRHARAGGLKALPMKPFCSGSMRDVRILRRAACFEIPAEELNPFYFDEPIAPWAAARKAGCSILLRDVVRKVARLAGRCELLLVEGAGGLLAPLGEGYTLVDLIGAIPGPVLVAARNRLGTINHSLLTLNALRSFGVQRVNLVLMDPRLADECSRTNPALLRQLAYPAGVFQIPFLGANATGVQGLRTAEKKLKKTLAQILRASIFSPTSPRKRAG